MGELFNSIPQSFNEDNYKILLKYITGNANATLATVTALAETNNNQFTSYGYIGTDASVFRAKTLSAGTQGSTSYSAKTNGKDICVRLGGLDWQVMYLSKDKSGNTILTLWLDNNTQDAWTSRSSIEGTNYGYVDGGLYSYWSGNAYGYYASSTYPSSMYGTSYINAVTLNNGGAYAVSGYTATTATKSSSSAFALFTMPGYGLTSYLVTPRQVAWQEDQSADTILRWGERANNESYSDELADEEFSEANYSHKEYYDSWADSYLWLPSLSEAGKNANYPGLWNTSTTQRANYDGSQTGSGGRIGTNYDYANTNSWLRSASSSSIHVTTLDVAGTSIGVWVDECYAVRPSLHLNLNSISQNTSTSSLSIADARITSYRMGTYTGYAHNPTYTIKYNETTLIKNTDYTVSYQLNGSPVREVKNAGTYTVIFTGTGSYTGTLTTIYTISPRTLTSISLSSTSSTYTGSAKSITATVKYNSTTLTSGTDYTLSYTTSSGSTVSSIINAGTYTITATGTGNYTGTVSATYTVNKANLGSITLSASSSTYSGSVKTPTITVKNSSSTTLTKGTDYTISYKLDGSTVSQIKDAGTYTITATGTGNYTGTKTATYTVNPRTISSLTVSPTSGTYTGSALSPTITVKYSSTTLIKNTHYTLTYTLNGSTVTELKEVGTYTITATGIGNYTGTKTATYTIGGYTVDSITVSPTTGTYDGTVLNPTITVKYQGTTLTKDTDYTLSYTLNGTTVSQIQSAGIYTITATGKGAYIGSVNTTYIVEGGTIADVIFYHPNECVVYKNSGDYPKIYLKDDSYKLIEGTDYTITYSINYTSLTGTATVTGMGNYGGIAFKTFTLVLLDSANSIYSAIWDM